MDTQRRRPLRSLALLSLLACAIGCSDADVEAGYDAGAADMTFAEDTATAADMAIAEDMATGTDTGVTGDMHVEPDMATSCPSGELLVEGACAPTWVQNAYVKASNTGEGDAFGAGDNYLSFHPGVSVSADGSRLAVGAHGEDSNATGIGGDQANNDAQESGAVYIFARSGTTWIQEAYIKASNTDVGMAFGTSVSLSADGSRLAVGARGEDSNATGVGGDQTDQSDAAAGAVYVFARIGSTWTQEAYIKASNTHTLDFFGESVSLSADGSRLAVGAPGESSDATGIDGNQVNDTASNSGAVYMFARTGTAWMQEAYVKASNTEEQDQFGTSVSLSGDGSRLAVGAPGESSDATGIGGDQANNDALQSGAVYIFAHTGTTWTQEAYVKASNAETDDYFGWDVSLSADGSSLAVGAYGEDSNATGIGGDQANWYASRSGAAYVFLRMGTTWSQEAYVKASNTGAENLFGWDVSLSADGSRLAVGAPREVEGAYQSGAVYVFLRTDATWAQEAYTKASNAGRNDKFGWSVSLSGNGDLLAVGAPDEDSNATGIDGDPTNDRAGNSGAVYVFNPRE